MYFRCAIDYRAKDCHISPSFFSLDSIVGPKCCIFFINQSFHWRSINVGLFDRLGIIQSAVNVEKQVS